MQCPPCEHPQLIQRTPQPALIQALREANLYHLAEPSHCLHHLDPLSLHCLRTRTHQGLNSNSYRSCQRSCLYIAIVGSMNK